MNHCDCCCAQTRVSLNSWITKSKHQQLGRFCSVLFQSISSTTTRRCLKTNRCFHHFVHPFLVFLHHFSPKQMFQTCLGSISFGHVVSCLLNSWLSTSHGALEPRGPSTILLSKPTHRKIKVGNQQSNNSYKYALSICYEHTGYYVIITDIMIRIVTDIQ